MECVHNVPYEKDCPNCLHDAFENAEMAILKGETHVFINVTDITRKVHSTLLPLRVKYTKSNVQEALEDLRWRIGFANYQR